MHRQLCNREEGSLARHELIELSAEFLLHQEAHQYLGSLEQPVGSLLATKPKWVKAFKKGLPDGCLREPWHQYQSHGCQLGFCSPGQLASGQP